MAYGTGNGAGARTQGAGGVPAGTSRRLNSTR